LFRLEITGGIENPAAKEEESRDRSRNAARPPRKKIVRASMTNVLHSALWNSRRGGVDVWFAGTQTLDSIAIPANQKLGAKEFFAAENYCSVARTARNYTGE